MKRSPTFPASPTVQDSYSRSARSMPMRLQPYLLSAPVCVDDRQQETGVHGEQRVWAAPMEDQCLLEGSLVVQHRLVREM